MSETLKNNINELLLNIVDLGSVANDESYCYNNCCLLNTLVYLVKENGSKFIKNDNISDSIILYNFLKQKLDDENNNYKFKLYQLGDLQDDSLIDVVSEIFNIRIGMYDIEKNIFSVHERCDKKNDYINNIIIY